MSDAKKTRQQLIDELAEMRLRIAELEELETRRKRAEEELIESEKKFRAIYDNANDGFISVDLGSGKFFNANRKMFEMLGYESEEETRGLTLSDIHPKEDLPYILGEFQRHANGEISRSEDLPVKRKDGSVFFASISSSPLTVANKRYLSCVFRDITERKRAEELMQESEEQLRSFMEQANDAIFIADGRGTIKFWNRKAEELYGYTTDEVLGKSNAVVVPKRLREVHQKWLEKYLSGDEAAISGKIVEGIGERKDGSQFYVETSTAILKQRDEKLLVAIIRDITERKAADERLREAKEQLEKYLENSIDPIIAGDSVGCVVKPNKAFLEMTGYAEEEIIGKHIYNLSIVEPGTYASTAGEVVTIPEDYHTKSYASITRLLEEGKVSNWETYYIHKSGKIIPITQNATLIYNDRGEVAGSFSIIRDLTGQKKAEKEKQKLEAQLQQAQKMEAIGTLAGGVAHDLNNILSAMIGYPELLLLNLPENSSLRKPLQSIKESGEKAAAIVSDLLTLARRGVNVSEVVNLNTVITEYLGTQQHEKLKYFHPRVEFEINPDPEALNIMGSAVHLSKTVMNLISNAAEAMPEGGEIIVSTENQYLDRPIKGYEKIQEGEYVVLTVKDSGIGISPDDLSRIFEPFYTKKEMGRSGTGLGLSVVWGTIQDHNGYIEVNSTPAKGTTFKLFFPATRKETAVKKQSLPIEKYSGTGEHILVVDDLESQREIASNMLKTLNYHVETAASGEEAVEYLKSNPADLVVLDMLMAPGIDGLETYRRILEIRPGQKAIIASGFSETVNVKEAQRLGAGTYVKKPYTLEKIGVAMKTELAK